MLWNYHNKCAACVEGCYGAGNQYHSLDKINVRIRKERKCDS